MIAFPYPLAFAVGPGHDQITAIRQIAAHRHQPGFPFLLLPLHRFAVHIYYEHIQIEILIRLILCHRLFFEFIQGCLEVIG